MLIGFRGAVEDESGPQGSLRSLLTPWAGVVDLAGVVGQGGEKEEGRWARPSEVSSLDGCGFGLLCFADRRLVGE